MSPVLIRQNLSVPSKHAYYAELWSGDDQASFSSSQTRGWLTDLELVGREWVGDKETGWGSVKVHRAILLPLCPYLASLAQDDTTLVFADVSLAVLKSVVQLLYSGTCLLSPEADVTMILNMMWSLGVCISPDMLQVVEKQCSEDVRADHLVIDSRDYQTSVGQRKSQVEDTIEHVVSMSTKINDIKIPDESSAIAEEMLVGSKDNVGFNLVNKCEESKFSCEECKENFQFYSHLLRHYKVIHPKKRFPCGKCDSTFPDLNCLAQHRRKVHIGLGDYQCNVCEYKAVTLINLDRHKKFLHEKRERMLDRNSVGFPKKVRVKNMPKPEMHDMKKVAISHSRASTGRKHNPEGTFHCHACAFKTMFKKSLDRHLLRFHEEKVY